MTESEVSLCAWCEGRLMLGYKHVMWKCDDCSRYGYLPPPKGVNTMPFSANPQTHQEPQSSFTGVIMVSGGQHRPKSATQNFVSNQLTWLIQPDPINGQEQKARFAWFGMGDRNYKFIGQPISIRVGENDIQTLYPEVDPDSDSPSTDSQFSKLMVDLMTIGYQLESETNLGQFAGWRCEFEPKTYTSQFQRSGESGGRENPVPVRFIEKVDLTNPSQSTPVPASTTTTGASNGVAPQDSDYVELFLGESVWTNVLDKWSKLPSDHVLKGVQINQLKVKYDELNEAGLLG